MFLVFIAYVYHKSREITVDRVVNCINSRAVIAYVKKYHAELLESLLADLDPFFDTVENVEEFLTDEHNWISQHVCAKLFERVRIFSGNPEVAREIGHESILFRRYGYIESILIKSFGHPYFTVVSASKINNKFNKTKTIEIVESGWSHAVMRLKWTPGLGTTKDICLYNIGVYEAIPTIWGLPFARISEHKCSFKGDNCCEFAMQWAKKPLFAFIAGLISGRKEIYKDSLAELEREKELVMKKYIEINNLNTELKKRVERLTSLDACSKATASLLDTDRLLDVVMSLIINVMQFDRALIMLVDEENRSLVPVKMVGDTGNHLSAMRNYAIPLDRKNNILARVVDSGISQIVADVDHSFLRKENLILKTFNPKSFVAVPLMTRNRVIGVMAAERIKGLADFSSNDLDYVMNFCSQIAISLENARLIENMKQSFVSSIFSLASALEAKDPYTRGHSNRVAVYSTIVARRMGMNEDRVELIRQMALMHDIGKIGIPDNIINKAGKLSPDELSAIRRHPLVSMQIIQPLLIYNPDLKMVRSHHERYDGLGYPDGLLGDDIPVEARILAVADSYDAMTTNRPYRAAKSREIALMELERNKGRQFCPHAVDIFLQAVASFPEDLLLFISDTPKGDRSADNIIIPKPRP